jgi:transcriptional regulator with GAF, ATPase, and Fis domain
MLDKNRTLVELEERQSLLRERLSGDHQEELIRFFVRILPQLLAAERCSIFLVEPGSERIWVRFGTGLEGIRFEAPRKGSVVGRTLSLGEVVIENSLDKQPGFHAEMASRTGFTTRSILAAPIKGVVDGNLLGVIEILNANSGTFDEEDAALLTEVTRHLSTAIETLLLHESVWGLTQSLSADLEAAKSRLAHQLEEERIVARSESMLRLLEQVDQLSKTPVGVLVLGQNGTGKELIAKRIHSLGPRREQPFVAVNCAAIPEQLMESEFFGYERGAFTGADRARGGRFEEADGGTLFLDEIADMPLQIQPKFLRAIQEGEGARLGSNRTRRYDLRIISATNRSLREEVAAGRFREDLYHRLFAVELTIPPLSQRPADILPLAERFLGEAAKRFNRPRPPLRPPLVELLESYHWPGNVRQLQREMERLVALVPEGELPGSEHLSEALRGHQSHQASSKESTAGNDGNSEETSPSLQNGLNLPQTVARVEQQLIRRALSSCSGNKQCAADKLGITRQGLHNKLKRYAIHYQTTLRFDS